MSKSPFADELVEILSKAVSNKIYGSVEVYFENGSITQVTQRIIKKLNGKQKKVESIQTGSSRTKTDRSKENELPGARVS